MFRWSRVYLVHDEFVEGVIGPPSQALVPLHLCVVLVCSSAIVSTCSGLPPVVPNVAWSPRGRRVLRSRLVLLMKSFSMPVQHRRDLTIEQGMEEGIW